MIADTSDIDTALLTTLQNDAQLHALLPDGVFWDIAIKAGSTRFVRVFQLVHEDTALLGGGDGWERLLYHVEVVVQSTSWSPATDAAKRIKELLHNQPLAVANYARVVVQRVHRPKQAERDPVTGAHWTHLGGHYEVVMWPIA